MQLALDKQDKFMSLRNSLFVPNHGQLNHEVNFSTQFKNNIYYFSPSQIACSLLYGESENKNEVSGITLVLQFIDPAPECHLFGAEPLQGKLNYFRGSNSSNWQSNIPSYGKLSYMNVWEGINLDVQHDENSIKLNWIINAGANPNNIRLRYDGANSLSVDEKGCLVINHAMGTSYDNAPVAYQIIDGEKVYIPCMFNLTNKTDSLSYGFQFGEEYRTDYPIIIDPLLPYASFLGGDSSDFCNGIAVDNQGCAYVTGKSLSLNFPVTPGAFQETNINGLNNAFVTKFSADGSQLLYSTYLGGSDGECYGYGIVIDDNGLAYVVGETDSTTFPISSDAYQNTNNGYIDVFVTILNAEGSALIYSTYLGGSDWDRGRCIQLGDDGFVYIAGSTNSLNFPTTTGAFQENLSADWNGYVTKLDIGSPNLAYSTYLGGNDNSSFIYGLAVDNLGQSFVTGETESASFPTTIGSFQPNFNGNMDVFVTKFLADGSNIIYSTYVGGNDADTGKGICIDAQGNAFVTGQTSSSDFPTTTGSAQPIYGEGSDAFIFKLLPNGSDMVYCTYLGGSDLDRGDSITLGNGNRACVTGTTLSSNFPTTPLVTPTFFHDSFDVFLTVLSEDGSSFIISNYIGGISSDQGYSIAVGTDNSIYIAGLTSSLDFPVTEGAFQTIGNNISDGFVYRALFVNYAKASVTLKKIGNL